MFNRIIVAAIFLFLYVDTSIKTRAYPLVNAHNCVYLVYNIC